MLRICTGVPHFVVNGVVRTRLTGTDLDARIEATLDYFRSRHLPLMWMVTPSTQPADLDTHLQAHGLTLLDTMPGMAIDLQDLPSSLPLPLEVLIQEVSDERMLADWSQVASVGFDLPREVTDILASISTVVGYGEQAPLRNLIAYWKGEPVGTSSLYLGGGVAGIYTVCVLPKARQQGIGAAITAAPLRIAREMGYRIGVLLASAMGSPVYRRLGFEEQGRFALYGWGAPVTPEVGTS